jgi:antitoxin FitA
VTAITVRNVPEAVRDELTARAARSGRSLQEYLLEHLIEMAFPPSCDEVIVRARARVAATLTRQGASDIVAARDEDRR